MNLWLRCATLHQCSWTIVYLELLKALREHTQVFDNFANYPLKESDCTEVWWGDPSQWKWSRKSKYKIGYALSEAESLRSEERELALKNIAKCDILICPSEYSSRAYYESPLDLPIRIVPLGYNPEQYFFTNRDWNGQLRVLLAGAAQIRKGSDLGIMGFIRAFGKSDRFHLTVWSSVKTPMREELKTEYGRIPNITFDDTNYDNPMEIYSKHHILLHPHLSEGFGIIPIEAMATGMCVLLSRVSSPMEYFSNKVGYWIEMSEDYVPIRHCLNDTNGFWRVPSVDSISERLKDISKHREDAQTKALLATPWAKKYTWEQTARKLLQAIREGSNADIGNDRSSL